MQETKQTMKEKLQQRSQTELKQGQIQIRNIIQETKASKDCSKQFENLSSLQEILQNQYVLLSTQQEQKSILQKKLSQTLLAYYKSTVHIGTYVFESRRSNIEQKTKNTEEKELPIKNQKKLFEDEGFGNAYIPIKQMLLSVSKDPFMLMLLLEQHQNIPNTKNYKSLLDSVVNSMYENIVDDDIYNKDLLKIVCFVLKMISDSQKGQNQLNMQQQGLFYDLISSFTERNDIKNYAKQVVKNTLLQITKIDHLIDWKNKEHGQSPDQKLVKSFSNFNMSRLQLKSIDSTKSIESPIKSNNRLTADKNSKIKVYAEGLRGYDQKVKRNEKIKRKNKNCTSQDLMRKLGISQQVNFPSFLSGSPQEIKAEQTISKQVDFMLSKTDSLRSESLTYTIPDISIVRNVIIVFFNEVFKMLYSMPLMMRIACRFLYGFLSQRHNLKYCLSAVGQLVINFLLCGNLRLTTEIIETGKLGNYTQKNIQTIVSIIQGILKNNHSQISPLFLRQFNFLLSNLKVSISNYLYQIVNIQGDQIDQISQQIVDFVEKKVPMESKYSINKIRSYCVCISVFDVKLLMEMIKSSEKVMNSYNDKMIKRVKSIEGKCDPDTFEQKKDKTTGNIYPSKLSFVLFTELSLPEQLSLDYNKFYSSSFKQSKMNNLIRQVILGIAPLNQYPTFHSSLSLTEFFQNLSISSDDGIAHAKDQIPISLKIRFLNVLLKKEKDIEKDISQLIVKTSERFNYFKQTWQKAKQCYLKALTSLNFERRRLLIRQQITKNQQKKKKLEDFIVKNQIKLCLTSPKTRSKQSVLKTNILKEKDIHYQQNKDKLWLQNQYRCMHSHLNLEFVKSLTGQLADKNKKYESHFTNIMKFPQILCSIPEVKEGFSLGQDSIGMKQIFYQFIQYCRKLIQSKGDDYQIISNDFQWVEENIEQKISKKIYQKLYPKMPTYEDIAFYLRLKTLNWIKFEHLRVNVELNHQNIWQIAANNLREIDKYRTAGEKLNCIVETCKIIYNIISLFSRKDRPVTADDMSPLVILTLIRAAPKRMISNISFIQSFANQNRLLSKEGYYFSQIKGAIRFCDTLRAEQIFLSENLSDNFIEFNQNIYQKQIEFGIYFMLGRRKDSPKSDQRKLEYLRQYFKKN